MSALATIPATAPAKVSSLAILAARLNVDADKLLATLKGTVFKGASNEEIMVLTVVANEYGLNPLIKEIYAFPAKGGGIVPVVSIDGWLRITNDHPQMDGLETTHEHDTDGRLVSCTCRIYRKDRQYPIVATEYLAECKRNTEPWRMEHRMLRHKAIIQCARIAFGFSGITDEDEGQVISGAEKVAKGREIARAEPLDPFRQVPDPVVTADWAQTLDEQDYIDGNGGAE
jgi:phage recombination protein Bet